MLGSAASRAAAGFSPGLCPSPSSARISIPSAFFADACFDGASNTLYLRNSSDFALEFSTGGAAGSASRTETDHGVAATATRLKYHSADLLLPGDTVRIPIGSGGASAWVEASSADGFYGLATVLGPLVPIGRFAGVATAFLGLVTELQADTAQYEDCKRSSSFVERLSCKPLLVRNVAFAVGRAGVGSLVAVVKGGASEILGTFITVVTGIKFTYNRVAQDPGLLRSPTLRIAGMSAGGGGAGGSGSGDSGGSGGGSGSGDSGGSGGGGSPGGGGGSGSEAATYAETTGSVAHTWTDYADAGGSEGPEIGSNQTVQVACWVGGFRVADGNTYWYEIASSPWSDAYYVSADAFYNDGSTSGTLSGTPFVDPAVPNCSNSGGGSSGGSKPTYAETTGGVSHTWTNYSDAGGTEGPDIGSNQTVQIACWVSGFRVADGNTYWYEIASSPWNDAYYVSADAFYNDGSTSGTLSGTPFVDPAVPNCSNSGGGSSGGSKPTYAETTGGVSHTWTNYSDAGGTEGPDIGSNQTVQIACWVSGFRVADGNTYWYEIASSPWNDAYYVSADAFYNNGSTSGSLIGTPFVDPAVPNCSNTAGGSTGGSKPSYAETTGGVAHTWTDYADAGGSEGPEIGSNQTLQISCWVSGFKVADGNTYWYQIGSSPWNDAYYVSADAFYNNGQTSGSLLGTPFVDPAVPQC